MLVSKELPLNGLDHIFQIGSSVLILGNIRRRLMFYLVVFHRDLL